MPRRHGYIDPTRRAIKVQHPRGAHSSLEMSTIRPLANIDLRNANVCFRGNANEGRCGSLRNCNCALTVAISFRQRGTAAKKSSLMHLGDRDERFYETCTSGLRAMQFVYLAPTQAALRV